MDTLQIFWSILGLHPWKEQDRTTFYEFWLIWKLKSELKGPKCTSHEVEQKTETS